MRDLINLLIYTYLINVFFKYSLLFTIFVMKFFGVLNFQLINFAIKILFKIQNVVLDSCCVL